MLGYSRSPLFRGFEELELAYLFDTGQNSVFPHPLLTTPFFEGFGEPEAFQATRTVASAIPPDPASLLGKLPFEARSSCNHPLKCVTCLSKLTESRCFLFVLCHSTDLAVGIAARRN